MKCPHCTVEFFEDWNEGAISRDRSGYYPVANSRACRCPACKQVVIDIALLDDEGEETEWWAVYPIGANRGPVPAEVPISVAADYVEACNVLPISAKASAALSRRCLQAMLRAHGYTAKDLAKEIDLLLNESDTRKAIPETLRVTIDGVRNFGNFSAHPITDLTSLQIIDVEEHEAEWCLEILEECFQHFYVRPAAANARKAALDAKLQQAGKPASK